MSYHVSFYREIVNSYGEPFKTPVYTVEIPALGSVDEAIAIALGALKRDRRLSCWSALADGYEVSYQPTGNLITTDRDAVAGSRFEAQPGGAAGSGDSPAGARQPCRR